MLATEGAVREEQDVEGMRNFSFGVVVVIEGGAKLPPHSRQKAACERREMSRGDVAFAAVVVIII